MGQETGEERCPTRPTVRDIAYGPCRWRRCFGDMWGLWRFMTIIVSFNVWDSFVSEQSFPMHSMTSHIPKAHSREFMDKGKRAEPSPVPKAARQGDHLSALGPPSQPGQRAAELINGAPLSASTTTFSSTPSTTATSVEIPDAAVYVLTTVAVADGAG
ncbi:hypothetical protein DFP73DRAFT_529932 [Morchella snyderi]|nr:hypothetical protein DFP73DRAFT_529932 [Morchella snyderi]